MRRTLALAVALGALGLAGALAQQPEGAEAPPPAVPPAAETPDVAALNPLATLDKSSLTGFRDMPLFTPSRKRPEEPVVEAEAPEPEPAPPPPPAPPAEPELKLSGVVEGPDGAVAIVQKDGETERLRLGDQVDGWLVTGIEGFSLKLTLNEREKEYRLFQRSEASAKPSGGEAEDAPEGADPAGVDPTAGQEQSPDQPEGGEPADQPEGQPQADQPEGEQPEGEPN